MSDRDEPTILPESGRRLSDASLPVVKQLAARGIIGQPFAHTESNVAARVEVHPLTAQRWHDFETLFGANGACGGCWCMLWRLRRREFDAGKGDGNRRAMRALVESGVVPGLLGYREATPVGWCALAPRDQYPALARSRILKPVDDRACWSVACLFVHRSARRSGVSVALLRAAADYVRTAGGSILEGYPVEPKDDKPVPAVFAWTGLRSAFEAAGFAEVARRSPTRPIMRRSIRPARPSERR